jgi:MFS transporter, DHA2 family, methylenomycin A resistance protein
VLPLLFQRDRHLSAIATGLAFLPLTLPALVAAILSAAPQGTAGAVGGLLNAVRQAGATLGVAAMGALTGIGIEAGSAYALLLSALVCAGAGAWFALASSRRR